MKMSRPTKQTITAMMAERGSSTQPRSTAELPNWNQVKLTTSRVAAPPAQLETTCPKAKIAISSEKLSDPIESVAASLRRGCLSNAITPDATMGNAGMSQRMPAAADAACGVRDA